MDPLSNPEQVTARHPTSPRHLLMIDRATGCLEAAPLSSIVAVDVAVAFIGQRVSRYGVPLNFITVATIKVEASFFATFKTSEAKNYEIFHLIRKEL